MLVNERLILSKYKYILAIIFVAMFMNTQIALANDMLDAGFVLREMKTEQQFAFVSGVIEGLAYARFLRDRPNEAGMQCISRWLHSDATGRWQLIEKLFTKHHDKPPAVLLHVLMKKQCGA